MKIKAILLIAVWGLVCLMQSAHARELKITVGFSHFPPWQIAQKGKLIGGIDKYIFEALKDELARNYDLHLVPEYYYCPLKRCLMMMQAGLLDLKTGLLRRPEREWYIYFVTPPYQKYINKALYIHKDQITDIISYGALRSLKVGVARASANFPKFDQDNSIEKIEVNGTQNGLQMLSAKRFDVFLGTELVTDYFLRKENLTSHIRKASFKYQEENPGYFGISKKSQLSPYLDQMRSAMKTIIDQGLVGQAVEQALSTRNLN